MVLTLLELSKSSLHIIRKLMSSLSKFEIYIKVIVQLVLLMPKLIFASYSGTGFEFEFSVASNIHWSNKKSSLLLHKNTVTSSSFLPFSVFSPQKPSITIMSSIAYFCFSEIIDGLRDSNAIISK